MSFQRPLRSLRPLCLSFLGFSFPTSSRSIFSSSTQASSSSTSNQCTRRLIRNPSPAAFRESPTPLIFVRAPGLASAFGLREEEGGSAEGWEGWSGMFAEKGWMGVEIDIEAGKAGSANSWRTSDRSLSTDAGAGAGVDAGIGGGGGKTESDPEKDLLNSMSSALSSQIRLLAIPFPPILLASGPSTLLTQAYISDHPASGLVLLDPPTELSDRLFNYEPRFPILLVEGKGESDPGSIGSGSAGGKDSSGSGRGRLYEASKAGVRRGGKGVEVVGMVDGPRGEKTRVEVERWMDRCGY